VLSVRLPFFTKRPVVALLAARLLAFLPRDPFLVTERDDLRLDMDTPPLLAQ
jgi:hypothetical protein